jgi:transcriptional regulator with XRE-family HTH domain
VLIHLTVAMDVVAQLGRNVRAIRIEIGISQEELAFRAGLKRSYLSDLERGTRNPTVRALGRIADALEVPPSRLLHD